MEAGLEVPIRHDVSVETLATEQFSGVVMLLSGWNFV